MKKFSEWIIAIGEGSIGTYSDSNINLEILEDLDLLIENTGDSMVDIVNSTYPNFLQRLSYSTYFKDRAILAPKNEIVDKVIEYMLYLIPLEEKTYLNANSLYLTDNDFDTQSSIHTPKFMNTIKTFSLPNHKLKLKIGFPIMLLQNIDPLLDCVVEQDWLSLEWEIMF